MEAKISILFIGKKPGTIRHHQLPIYDLGMLSKLKECAALDLWKFALAREQQSFIKEARLLPSLPVRRYYRLKPATRAGFRILDSYPGYIFSYLKENDIEHCSSGCYHDYSMLAADAKTILANRAVEKAGYRKVSDYFSITQQRHLQSKHHLS